MSQNIKTSNGWVKTAGNFDTTEITNARSGIDGTVYNSLDTRLDTEIGQLNDDIVDLNSDIFNVFENGILRAKLDFSNNGWVNKEGVVNNPTSSAYKHTKGVSVKQGDILEITFKPFETSNLIAVVKASDVNGTPIHDISAFYVLDSVYAQTRTVEFEIPSGVNYITITSSSENISATKLVRRKSSTQKIGLAFGDSITRGQTNDGVSYVNKVKNKLGLYEYYNYSIAGTHPKSMIETQLTNFRNSGVSTNDISFITLASGVNDYIAGSGMGSLAHVINDNDKLVIETFINEFPNVPIIYLLPMQRDVVTTNSANYTLLQYVNALKDLCDSYSIPTINMYTSLGINTLNIDTFTNDGTHPNDLGHEKIALLVEDCLKKYIKD